VPSNHSLEVVIGEKPKLSNVVAFAAFVVCVACLYVCALMLPSPASPSQPGSDVSPVRPVVTCQKVAAKTFNKKLKVRQKLGGPKPKQFANRPVCAHHLRKVNRDIRSLKKREARRLETDVRYAIARAFDPLGRTAEALRVAHCESTHNRFATNGQYRGLFQLGAHHYFRLRGKPYSHAYANARAAASIVAADGGWGQWSCQP
jgi:hypothetical protein